MKGSAPTSFHHPGEGSFIAHSVPGRAARPGAGAGVEGVPASHRTPESSLLEPARS